jgi:hypothetical protein
MDLPTKQQIHEAAARLGEFTLQDLRDALDLPTFGNYRTLSDALKALRRWGHLQKVGTNSYRYTDKRGFSKKGRMWRAMLIKSQFTRKDVAKLAECSIDYVHKYFAFLLRKKWIILISKQGHNDGLYRLADPDAAPLEHPK